FNLDEHVVGTWKLGKRPGGETENVQVKRGDEKEEKKPEER
ncbi:unnamed protein product, partial [Urochloa humidicola]